jgi:two-component system cell cycle response regulator
VIPSGKPLVALRLTQGAALAGLVAYGAQAATAVCGSSADDFFETYVYTALIFIAALLCLSRAAAVRRERAAWLVLGLGLLFWSGGEIYYSIAWGDFADPPLPSVADALWIAFYPACYIAMVLLLRERVRDFRASVWLDGVVGGLAVATVGAALVFGAITAQGADSRAVAVDLTYLMGDLLLLALVVAVFAVTGWRPGRAWSLLGAGLGMSAIVDGFFLHQAAIGADATSTLPAALWPASALLVGWAAWQRPARQAVRIEGLRLLVLPALFALVALAALAYYTVHPVNPLALGLALATLLAVILRMVLTFGENMRLLEGTRREAMTDALTGLANRRRLMIDLADAVAAAKPERPCALVIVDLDGFKQYNDRFGHPLGDALLGQLGRNLAATVGDDGRAYRLGGDEFCVVASGARDDLLGLARRARAALQARGRGFEVGSSYGFVLVPDEARNVSQALRLADERLYEQKGERRRTTVTCQTSDALLQVLKEWQPALNGHLDEVAHLARRVGKQLGLGPGELEEVTRAAQLHDIGKIAVPKAILGKSGALDDDEWEFVRQHTQVGDRILSAAPALTSVARLVRASHEHWDGSGYPDGLMHDEIPLGARIVAVCDAYHAMTGGRPYRQPVEPAQAIRELRRCSGAQFDPWVVEAFCELLLPETGDRPRARV